MANYEYAATVHRVVDGDTCYLALEKEFSYEIDFGFRIKDQVTLKKSTVMDFRLYGINTPEMRTPEGPPAKEELIRLLGLGTLRVITHKQDKYGRWLAQIYVKPPDEPEIYVNQALIDGGFAVVYLP